MEPKTSNPPGTTGAPPAVTRAAGRGPDQLRPLQFRIGIAPHAAGSTLVEWGNTRVICGVTIEETVPRWMKDQGIPGGWITAEYSMLPYSTLQRKPRDSSKGRTDGRSQEIQRLIGRAMRAAVDLKNIGTRTLWVDCDVLQADGGTRTAAITGSYVALALALRTLQTQGNPAASPRLTPVAAVSVGLVNGVPLLDLDYTEDSAADVDLNLVMTAAGQYIEVQGTGERTAFSDVQLGELLRLGRLGIDRIIAAQTAVLAQTHAQQQQ